jgi:hypothetical protein
LDRVGIRGGEAYSGGNDVGFGMILILKNAVANYPIKSIFLTSLDIKALKKLNNQIIEYFLGRLKEMKDAPSISNRVY